MSGQHRDSYRVLVAALREEFTPVGLAVLWGRLRTDRYDITSIGVLARAIHDARDPAYDAGKVHIPCR